MTYTPRTLIKAGSPEAAAVQDAAANTSKGKSVKKAFAPRVLLDAKTGKPKTAAAPVAASPATTPSDQGMVFPVENKKIAILPGPRVDPSQGITGWNAAIAHGDTPVNALDHPEVPTVSPMSVIQQAVRRQEADNAQQHPVMTTIKKVAPRVGNALKNVVTHPIESAKSIKKGIEKGSAELNKGIFGLADTLTGATPEEKAATAKYFEDQVPAEPTDQAQGDIYSAASFVPELVTWLAGEGAVKAGISGINNASKLYRGAELINEASKATRIAEGAATMGGVGQITYDESSGKSRGQQLKSDLLLGAGFEVGGMILGSLIKSTKNSIVKMVAEKAKAGEALVPEEKDLLKTAIEHEATLNPTFKAEATDIMAQAEKKAVTEGAISKTTSAPKPKLPKDLAGAKPSYSYGSKQFQLSFANDLDKAAYISAQKTVSKRDADFIQFVAKHTGLSEQTIRANGQAIKDSIKAMAKDGEPGVLKIKDSGLHPLPQPKIPKITETPQVQTPTPVAEPASMGQIDPMNTPSSGGPVNLPPTLAAPGEPTVAGMFGEKIIQDPKTPQIVRDALEQRTKVRATTRAEQVAVGNEFLRQGDAFAEAALSSPDVPQHFKPSIAKGLMEKYRAVGDAAAEVRVIETADREFSQRGQALEAIKLFSNMSPQAMGLKAEKIIKEFNENKWFFMKEKKLTPEMMDNFKSLADRMKALPDGVEKTALENELKVTLGDLKYVGLGRKISTFQMIMQLANPKTILIRNPIGNEAAWRMERLFKYFASPIDWARVEAARAVGIRAERKVTFRGVFDNSQSSWRRYFAPSIEFAKGAATGFMDGLRGVNQSNKYDVTVRVFKSKYNPVMWMERLTGAGLTGLDKAAYNRAYQVEMRSQAWLLAENMRLDGLITRAESNKKALQLLEEGDAMAEKAAKDYADYITYQDKNLISSGLVSLKKGLNAGKDFGFGDLVAKYGQTPGSIVMKAIETSPLGYAKAIGELAPLLKGKAPDAKKFEMAIVRATVGTLGFTGLGYELAKKGFITGRSSKDADVRAMDQITGNGQYKVNYSAIKRYIMSGGKDESIKDGDIMYSYDWFQPYAISISMGANAKLGQKKGVLDNVSMAAEAITSGADTVMEQSLFQGFKKLFGGQSIAQGAWDVATSLPTSFTPTLGAQVRNYQDNTAGETYDPNALKTSWNKTKNRVPGWEKSLPRARTNDGEIKMVNQPGQNTIFNIFLNPGYVSKLTSTPESKMVMDLYKATGETKQFPTTAPKDITVDGQKISLTPEQYVGAQEFLGKRTKEYFGKLAKNPLFNHYSDDKKVSVMASKIAEIGAELKAYYKDIELQRLKKEDPTAYERVRKQQFGKSQENMLMRKMRRDGLKIK